jgi:hypothetical protein
MGYEDKTTQATYQHLWYKRKIAPVDKKWLWDEEIAKLRRKGHCQVCGREVDCQTTICDECIVKTT